MESRLLCVKMAAKCCPERTSLRSPAISRHAVPLLATGVVRRTGDAGRCKIFLPVGHIADESMPLTGSEHNRGRAEDLERTNGDGCDVLDFG